MRLSHYVGLAIIGGGLGVACGPANAGNPGSSEVTRPAMTGTIFTIVFENHDQGAVLNTSVPYFNQLAREHGSADAYLGSTHPSLPNYIQLTGSTVNITDNNPPSAHPIAGVDNLGGQLEAANIPWRAYMESMVEPCRLTDNGEYAVRHNPWVYYTALSGDSARCADRVVDFESNFTADLAANRYRYMWITPNVCNDMHDCAPSVSDAWLSRVIPQIMASPGYQAGGAIFILFDEGSLNLQYLLRTPQNLAAIVISPNLVAPGHHSSTAYSHFSYVATVEDMLRLPRLASTAGATPMSDFFVPAQDVPAPATTTAP